LGLFSCEEGGSTSGSKYPPEIQSYLGYYIKENENSAALFFFREAGDSLYLFEGHVQRRVNVSQLNVIQYSKAKSYRIEEGEVYFTWEVIDGFISHGGGGNNLHSIEKSWYTKVSLSSFKEKIANYMSPEDIAKIFFI
jgi:hypothetical protein